jgi:hypothetical protein
MSLSEIAKRVFAAGERLEARGNCVLNRPTMLQDFNALLEAEAKKPQWPNTPEGSSNSLADAAEAFGLLASGVLSLATTGCQYGYGYGLKAGGRAMKFVSRVR